jgi:spore coat polysaccharide biosynthesis predicted glycosyltransferase SpsG
MRIILAIEASHQRGMGHLFRGLRLAKALRTAGNEVLIVCNPDRRSEEIIRKEQFALELTLTSESNAPWENDLLNGFSPRWWIDDRLDTDRYHAELLARAGISHATFDDHGTGAHLARYNFLAMDPAPEHRCANGLYGPDYMILDPGIATYREKKRPVEGKLRIAVTLGGSDTYGITPRAVEVVASQEKCCAIEVVIGPNFIHERELTAFLSRGDKRIRVHPFVPDLYELLASTDIVICGGGVTLYEAASLGVPAIIISNEPHEVTVARWFVEQEFGVYAGFQAERYEDGLSTGLAILLNDRAKRNEMARRGKALVDGKGLSRVLSLLSECRNE